MKPLSCEAGSNKTFKTAALDECMTAAFNCLRTNSWVKIRRRWAFALNCWFKWLEGTSVALIFSHNNLLEFVRDEVTLSFRYCTLESHCCWKDLQARLSRVSQKITLLDECDFFYFFLNKDLHQQAESIKMRRKKKRSSFWNINIWWLYFSFNINMFDRLNLL